MDLLAYCIRSWRVGFAVWRCWCPASLVAWYGELQSQIILACVNLLHMSLYLEWLVRLVPIQTARANGCRLRVDDRPPIEVSIRLVA